MVPVSIRTGEEKGDDVWSNRVSAIVAELPTNCADPVERVERCRVAMQAAKRQMDLLPAEAMMEASQVLSPVIAASAIRLVGRLKLADRVNSPVNVVISNVPGPREPLYFAGAKLDAYIPVSTISDGVGLNITVHSYEDRLDIGLISDRELIPDLWHLVDLHVDEIERLFEATGAEWAVPPAPAADASRRPRDRGDPAEQPRGCTTDREAAGDPNRSDGVVGEAARRQAAGRQEAGDEEAGDEEAGDEETGGEEAGDEEAGRRRSRRRRSAKTAGEEAGSGEAQDGLMSASISAPPVWMTMLEYRALGERAQMSAMLPLLRRLPAGDGHPVLVLPGFSASDRSTDPLRNLLRRLGYRTYGWGLGVNVGPTPRILDGLVRRLDRAFQRRGQQVSIVGWSLGGIYARELARARPEMVRQVVTLGSPIQMIEADSSSAQPMWEAMSRYHSPGFRREMRDVHRPPLTVPEHVDLLAHRRRRQLAGLPRGTDGDE